MSGRLWTGRVILAAAYMLTWPVAFTQGNEDSSRNPIAEEVRHQLITLPYYTVFDNLDFRVAVDTVTLLGQVTRPVLKSAAERAVEQIKEVGRVYNQIEVLPPSTEDDRMRLAVYGATYAQPNLSQYATQAVAPVHIIVERGNVTLEGTVDMSMDKAEFFTQTSGVPGVVSVTDRLRVTH
jgi:hyperosmotically inducible periplasmic protein